MESWLRYLIALTIGFHGMIYLIAPYWLEFRDWKGVSFLLGSTFSGDSLRTLSMGLWVVAGICLLGCALAIALAPIFVGWWRPIAIGGGVVGALSFPIFWDGQLQQFTNQGGIGMLLSLAIVGVAIAFSNVFR